MTRTRKQIRREIVQHTQRIQAVLEAPASSYPRSSLTSLGPQWSPGFESFDRRDERSREACRFGGERLGCSRHEFVASLNGRVTSHHGFMLAQCGWAAARSKDTYLQAQFLRIKSRRGPKKAAVAVVASILRAAYYILRDSTVYRDLGSDYFDRRNEGRVVECLVKRLQGFGYEVELRDAA